MKKVRLLTAHGFKTGFGIKPIVMYIVLLAIGSDASGQITLESNSHLRQTAFIIDTSASNFYFRYKKLDPSREKDLRPMVDEAVEVKRLRESEARKRDTAEEYIKRVKKSYEDLLIPLPKDASETKKLRDSLNGALQLVEALTRKALELDVLKGRINADRVKLQAKADSSRLDAIRNAYKEVEINLRRLLHLAWDFKELIDTTKEVTNYNDFFHAVVNLRADMETLLENDIMEHYKDIKHLREEYFSTMTDSILSHDPMLSEKYVAAADRRIQSIQYQLTEDTVRFDSVTSQWNRMIASFIKTKKTKAPEEKKIDVSALPFFNIIPGIKDINSSLAVFGSNKPSQVKNGLYTEFGGFTGLFGNKEEENLENLLIPESSNYGFFLKLNLGLVPKFDTSINRVGINTSFHYLGKSFQLDTTRGVDPVLTTLFQGKFGLEYVLVKNLMSVYSNINSISLVQNKQLFNTKFKDNKDIKGYIDFGVRMLLEPGKGVDAGQFKLYFDLNFIVNGGDIKSITNSSDNIITNIRFGLRTTLGNL